MDFSGYSSCGGFDDGQGVKSRLFFPKLLVAEDPV